MVNSGACLAESLLGADDGFIRGHPGLFAKLCEEVIQHSGDRLFDVAHEHFHDSPEGKLSTVSGKSAFPPASLFQKFGIKKGFADNICDNFNKFHASCSFRKVCIQKSALPIYWYLSRCNNDENFIYILCIMTDKKRPEDLPRSSIIRYIFEKERLVL